MKETTKNVFNYIKEHDGEDFTAKDIAAELGYTPAQVNGSVTSFQNHKDADKNKVPLAYREEVNVEDEDGAIKSVKLIRLTDEGRAFEVED